MRCAASTSQGTRPMNNVPCPVCSTPLTVRPATGRKSGKPFVMLVCPEDGRHFRGFISDKEFVDRVIEKAGIQGRIGAPGTNG